MKSVKDPRHNARKIALSSLFCSLYEIENQKECFLLSEELLDLADYDKILAEKLITGIRKQQPVIDDVVERCAPEWPVDKISKVDLVILRIAVFEILFSEDVPDKVIIDEAVELAKEFGSDTSSKFVNGVLGTVVDIKESIKK